MTRRRMIVGLVGGATTALCACTTLLGDFQTGTIGTDGGSGSSSVLSADGASSADGAMGGGNGSLQDGGAPSDAGPTDAAAEAAPPALLPCAAAAGTAAVNLATINRSPNNDQNTVRLFNVGTPNQQTFRAIVPEQLSTGPTAYHTFTFGNGNGSVPDAPIPEDGQMVALARYQGGIAALVSENLNDAGTSTPVLDVYTIADTANAWTGPVVLLSGAPLPQCVGRASGALWVLNAGQQVYLYDFTYQSCGSGSSTATSHLVGQTNAPAAMWPLPLENMLEPDGGDAGVTVDASAEGFSVSGITAATPGGGSTPIYALANSGSGGPAPGIGSTLFTSSVQNLASVSPRELPLVDPADLMQAVSVQTLPSTGNIGLAFLEANLTVQNVAPMFYVGSVPTSRMAMLDPNSDLAATALDTISDVPINSAVFHWESFSTPIASDNMLGVGPVFNTGAGLNFLWWDASGTLRARNTSSAALFPNAGVILGGDVTFTGAPFPALGQFEAVYLTAQSDSSTLTDVYAMQFQCTAN